MSDIYQSKKFSLDSQFWIELHQLESGEACSEYSLNIAYRVKELEKKGFVNPRKNCIPDEFMPGPGHPFAII